ncbi:MAG: hypothetical protein GY880_13795, partial [Planctomycetaceae bacterium]|nr:hypothetical protein [Planctomycetaceae bacterium]
MGQQTFNDGESLESVRSKLNGNAIDSVTRLGSLETFSTFNNISDIVTQINGSGSQTLLSSNSLIPADGAKGSSDPTGESAGWYFKNSDDLTEKVNWYYLYD